MSSCFESARARRSRKPGADDRIFSEFRRSQAPRATVEQVTQELAIAEIRHAAAIAQAKRFADLLPLAEQQIRDGRQLADAGQLDPMLILDSLLRVHKVKMAAIAADAAAARASITLNTLLTDPQSSALTSPSGDER